MATEPSMKSKQKKTKVAKPRPNLEADGSAKGKGKLVRALGSPDYHTREKAVKAISRFLARKTGLGEKSMLKVWKGIFYAFWHSDKAPIQEELAERLAGIMEALPEDTGLLYFIGFMKTMRREWFGIDRLRLDKYLMLVRKFIAQVFHLLAANKWQQQLVTRYVDFLRDSVVIPPDAHRAVGLTFHIADLYLPELRRLASVAVESGASSERAAVPGPALRSLLRPFTRLLEATPDLHVLTRVREALFDELVQEVAEPEEGEPLRHLDAPAFAADLFELGAKPETLYRNRSTLYEISSALEQAHQRRQKKLKRQLEGDIPGVKASVVSEVPGISELPQKKAKRKSDAQAVTAVVQAQPQPVAPGSLSQVKVQKLKGSGDAPVRNSHDRSQQGLASSSSGGMGAEMEPAVARSTVHPGIGGSAAKKLKQPIALLLPAPMRDMVSVNPSVASNGTASKPFKPKSALKVPKPASDSSGFLVTGASIVKSRSNGEPASGGAGSNASTPLGGASSSQKQIAAPRSTTGLTGGGNKTARGAGAAAASAAKKRVKIDLKQNLYHSFGGPVPHPDVRTPSRVQGGILKVKPAPRSAPPKVGGGGGTLAARQGGKPGKQGAASVGKGPTRARASLFF